MRVKCLLLKISLLSVFFLISVHALIASNQVSSQTEDVRLTTDVLQVREYILSNGLKVWLNEDRTRPQVFGAVVVNAGARDCPDTGIAHYFEHIMFKGTDKIGTTDYESEKVYLDSIAAKYDELAATVNEAQRAAIQQDINRLSICAAEYAIPNEFSRLISEYGGSGLNAFTSQDVTVYLNTFSSQYIEQWAELNSERMISPVFRLFQSELETVYEEKNMHNNNLGFKAIEKLTERVMSPSEYAYPVVGSTENLKNPRLSEMKAFFEKYYVASNMGLMLSGDFDAETVLPVLERTFSRIPRGVKPERKFTEPDYFKGKETFTARVKIPIIKAGGLVYEGVTRFETDYNAFNLAISMLSNTNTGYLNQLNVDGKLTFADITTIEYDKVGLTALIIIPKIPFQSFGKAEKRVLHEINRIKAGDFTDEMLEGAKLALKSNYQTSLEDVRERAQLMLSCFSNEVEWETFLSSVAAIEALTKEDVVRVANKYFGNDYLEIRKKYGDYPNDNISKPPYQPVIPPHKDTSSVYSETLKTLPVGKSTMRLIDFDTDVETIELQSLAKLYVSKNPVNDIFSLKIVYEIGKLEDNRLSHLAHYLSLIGTNTLSFEAFGKSLYNLGAEVSFEADNADFVISVKGFDQYFDETVRLIGDFMHNYKVDDKKLKSLKDLDKMNKTMTESASAMASVLFEKVRYGEESSYLKKTGKIKYSDISEIFEKVQSTACNIHYCGNNESPKVGQLLKECLPVGKIKNVSTSPVERTLMIYDQPTIYFLDMPKSSQSIVYSYIPVDALSSMSERNDAKLLGQYLGAGGMSSVLFQEIREFRSLAYSAWGVVSNPIWKNRDKKSFMCAALSTQCDKTSDAVFVLDSLLKHLPFIAGKMETIKKDFYSELVTNYPSFRHVSERISKFRRSGYEEDPTKYVLEYLENTDVNNIEQFYNQYIHGKPIVYCIVGDSKKIDMKRLETFGRIIEVKKKDIFKK